MILKYAMFTLTVSVVPLVIILRDLTISNYALSAIRDSLSTISFESLSNILSSGVFTYFTLSETVNSNKDESSKNIFTIEELAKFNGKNSEKLYLAILGNVFDVTEAVKYYGPGETYNVFTGRDGTRAFITGDFTENGLIDDAEGLSLQELRSLNEWVKFYFKTYSYKGKLIGRYFDKSGRPTGYNHKLQLEIEKAIKDEKEKNMYQLMFPPCNVEWSPEDGSHVWCSERSGGVERDWVGVPRKLYEPGSKSYRCACVNISELPQVISPETGKVRSGTLEEYEDCHPKSTSCYIHPVE